MLDLTNSENLTNEERGVFNTLKRIVENTVWICRCKADGTIINNYSPIEDKLFLKSKIEKALLSTFPKSNGAFSVTVYHPSKGELAVNEIMEVHDSEIQYSIELEYELSYYIKLIKRAYEKNNNK